MGDDTANLARLEAIALALPEAERVDIEAWDGEPTFRVRNKLFAMYASAGNHHGDGRPAAWINAAPANQELLVKAEPDRYFVPAYVGPSGWVGVWLDRDPSWDAIAELLRDGYRRVAPKRLLAALDGA